MSPVLNGNSEIEHFECSDVIKISDRVMFVFFPGLRHIIYIGYTTPTQRFSAYTLQGRSPSSVSTKPLSGSGITGLYHSNVVYS